MKLVFKTEQEFEDALINVLKTKGWEENILEYKTEEDLIQNWADILFENNRSVDRLCDYPLTRTEMQQILDNMNLLKTPLALNGFINGKTTSIVRDNPDDKEHFGKAVSLKIYDRDEIAAGQSRYQIARQPKFAKKSALLHDRRGDVMLLINGMPVIHIELKKSGISVEEACYQIQKYSHEHVFTGLFSLVQVFVAMTPEETVYFANPGTDGIFNSDYYFHWADFNNDPINEWDKVAQALLSIPMAHQMIGFYTVADSTDGILKVMRSYQYFAASAISDKVSKTDWGRVNPLGGFIWHTTGSGKTLTSFKAAQLISNSQDADKVVFLMDRIELGTQSLRDYRGFADDSESVQATEDTNVLVSKLKSDDPNKTLIVTSIQKMSRIYDDAFKANVNDLKKIRNKKIVFIVDECHRSTFGDMLSTIKNTFPEALFFGFTGTPIKEKNQKNLNTTATIFGDELHRYSIAHGMRDKNVLGFDTFKIATYDDLELRQKVALDKAKVGSIAELNAEGMEKNKKVYNHFMNPQEVKMCGFTDDDGNYHQGIEDYVHSSQYDRKEHREIVVNDIVKYFPILSRGGKFHGIFATSSIPEAIKYYALLSEKDPELKVAIMVDENIDNDEKATFKEDGLVKALKDYNERYGHTYGLSTYDKYKKDVAARLAHKAPYIAISKTPDQQLDLLIVVNQMLTGFDSKWINTLYLDKVLEHENIIQSFSRTNRLFGDDKPFGIIRYYRKPHTMERNIQAAVKLYSGDSKLAIFVEKLPENLKYINSVFEQISDIFKNAGIDDFSSLPSGKEEKRKFAKLFIELERYLVAAKIQGFTWEKQEYYFEDGSISVIITEDIYLTLRARFKELSGGGSVGTDSVPYALKGSVSVVNSDTIDTDYMNSRFEKYKKALDIGNPEDIEKALDEVHKSFAMLSKEEQKYAEIFLHDVQRGDIKIEAGKSLRDYITEYQVNATNTQIHQIAEIFGLDESALRNLIESRPTEATLNEYGRFDKIKNSFDKVKARAYFEKSLGRKIMPFEVNIHIDELLRKIVLEYDNGILNTIIAKEVE